MTVVRRENKDNVLAAKFCGANNVHHGQRAVSSGNLEDLNLGLLIKSKLWPFLAPFVLSHAVRIHEVDTFIFNKWQLITDIYIFFLFARHSLSWFECS